MAEPLVVRLAARAARIAATALPDDVRTIATNLVLDQLGVQLCGAALPNVAPVARLVAAVGGTPDSAVTGTGLRTSAPYAAYANGTFGHACQYDDSHQLAWHPGSCVVPAVLALAEREGRSGAEVLAAVVAGTQVMAELGAATTAPMQRLGWHGAKVLGVFGAAVGAGLMVGLPTDRLAQAIALAASDSAGTMEYDVNGGEVKRLHAGSAARAGCEAALLARDGLTAPLSALDGTKGLLPLLCRLDAADAVARVDEAANRLHVRDLIFRMHPTVGTAHAPLDAIAILRDRHRFGPEEVAQIRIGVSEYAKAHGGSITRPHDVVSAQYCIAYSVGLLLTRGRDRPRDYVDATAWRDPDVLAVADRTEVYATELPDDAPMLSARVDVSLHDGRSVGMLQRGFHGHPTHPVTSAELVAKFRENLADLRVDAEVDELVALLADLGRQPDVHRIMHLVGSAPSG